MSSLQERRRAVHFCGIEDESRWGFYVVAEASPSGKAHWIVMCDDASLARRLTVLFLKADHAYPFMRQTDWRINGVPSSRIERHDGRLSLVPVVSDIDGTSHHAIAFERDDARFFLLLSNDFDVIGEWFELLQLSIDIFPGENLERAG